MRHVRVFKIHFYIESLCVSQLTPSTCHSMSFIKTFRGHEPFHTAHPSSVISANYLDLNKYEAAQWMGLCTRIQRKRLSATTLLWVCAQPSQSYEHLESACLSKQIEEWREKRKKPEEKRREKPTIILTRAGYTFPITGWRAPWWDKREYLVKNWFPWDTTVNVPRDCTFIVYLVLSQ